MKKYVYPLVRKEPVSPRRGYNKEYRSRPENKAAYRLYMLKVRDKRNLRQKLVRRAARLEMIEKYGGCCTCCGETTPCFLEISHRYNDGKDHRMSAFGRKSGGHIAVWLKARGWPKKGLHLLCANCHAGKTYHGKCPHRA